MICYFDSTETVNLSHLPDIREVRSLTELKNRLINVEFLHTTEYIQPGLYVIEVSKIATMWCAKTHPNSFNLLLNVPSRVVNAVKSKILRIVILAIVEGDNFTSDSFDGFDHLHNTVQLLRLPKKSVVIVSGNLNAAIQYSQWCKTHNKQELIEFLEGVEWDGKASNNCIDKKNPVIIKDNSLSFNSLNRAHRNHRSEHLYFLAENKLQGLISGGAWFSVDSISIPIYQLVDYDHYSSVLLNNYPKSVDISDLVNTVPNLINNLEIYENSQLTVVTETHFDQSGGLFITEKTFRPILVGHPFIILGQKGILQKLESWGFKTDFLDTSYDLIDDNRLRFIKFHEVLLSWYNTSLEEKRLLLQKWKNTIDHNFNHYKNINFKKLMFDCAVVSSEQYFKECS